MGKGFILEDVEGQDLADLFHQAFKRKVITKKILPIAQLFLLPSRLSPYRFC
jgi:hypothetical protein